MTDFEPSDFECFDKSDNEIFKKTEALTNKYRNKDGVLEFKDDNEFKDFLHDLLSTDTESKLLSLDDPGSSFAGIIQYNNL